MKFTLPEGAIYHMHTNDTKPGDWCSPVDASSLGLPWPFHLTSIRSVTTRKLLPMLLPLAFSSELPFFLTGSLSHSAPATLTKYQRRGGLNSRHLFLTVLEARSPRSTCPLIQFLVKGLYLACRSHLSPVFIWPYSVHVCAFLIRLLIPSRGPHPHDLI